MIIGLSGWRGSGKDAAASFLVNEFKFKRISFAHTLKDMVAEQYDIPRNSLDDPNLKDAPLFQYPLNPQDDFSKMISDFLKKEFKMDGNGKLYWTPRALAILEGSVKRSVNVAYWTNRALSQIKAGDLVVISDLRYKSEASQIRGYANATGQKSLLIRINRFDEPPSDDPSERDLDDYRWFDAVVENRGSLEEYKEKILNFVFSKL
jgi:hypothetical protein